MTVRLTVHRAAWLQHVRAMAGELGPSLVPVVKGNGYGFSRPVLHEIAQQLGASGDGGMVCVGTTFELHDVPAAVTPVVLTPTLTPPNDERAILTVGSVAHVHALRGWHGRVMVKLASSMRRFGATPDELDALLTAVTAAGLEIEAFAIHLPLIGDDAERVAEIEAWLPHLPDGPLWLSHLQPESFAAFQLAHPSRAPRIRVGTALWHGLPRSDFLHVSADVLHTHPVRAGDVAGYFHTPVAQDATLVAIGAGSTHGIAALDDPDPSRRSPFHFARHRLPLFERPHMHTSLVLVPPGQRCPHVGEQVDVQRPLIGTHADVVEWT